MIPLDSGDVVRAALHNVGLFDQAAFTVWLGTQSEGIVKLAKVRKPNAIYRIVTDGERDGAGTVMMLGVIIGYKDGRGAPASAAVHVLGVGLGAGAYETPLVVPGELLINVTDEVLAGKLTL
jgi:hypothetical protein